MLVFNNLGIVAPTTEEIIKQFEQIFINVFGPETNTSAQSINGLLIQELTNNAVENNNNLLNLFNQYSILTANGLFLDFIGNNYNVIRNPGSFTVLQITALGATATVIPQGIEISDELGNIYTSTDSYIIGPDGSVVCSFASSNYGPFIPNTNTVTNILSFVVGLDSVTNTGVADVAGSFPESDADYRVRITEDAFDSQRGTYRSMEAALSMISDDFILIENYKSVPETISGISIDPHSIYVSSNQGTDLEIATAIFEYKSMGCGLVGDRTVDISGYTIKFNRPTLVNVSFVVQVKNVKNQPPNITELIKNTILNSMKTFSRIGQTLFSSEFIAALNNVDVLQIEFVKINDQTSVSSEITQLLVTTAESIEIQLTEAP